MNGVWRANPTGDALFPNWDLFPDYGIKRFYVPTHALASGTTKYVQNTAEISLKYAEDIRSHGVEYSTYFDPTWIAESDPVNIAQVMSSVTLGTHAKGPMLDWEAHFISDALIDWISAYRHIVPTGNLSWTMEPFQAGWMTQALVRKINADINFSLVVQNFYFDMTPAGTRHGKTPRMELVDRGFHSNRVLNFYDGRRIAKTKGQDWSGCILSEERLAA